MADTMDFFHELDALGLRDLPVAYGVDGVPVYSDDVSDEDRASIEATLAKYEWSTGRPLIVRTEAAKLILAKAEGTKAIDVEAERQRLRWITPGAGQAMTYARKVEEAHRLGTEPDPQAEAFPMLAASIGIDGADLAAVATTVLAMDAAWGRIGGAIEARRLGLKRDMAQAATPADLALIDISTGWPE